MNKLIFIATIVICGAVLSFADETTQASINNEQQNKGTLHKTLEKLNSVAEKVPAVVKSINDRIEVRVENVVNPQEDKKRGIVSSSIRGAANLVGSVGRQIGGFATTVGQAAFNMTRNTADVVRTTVKKSINRIGGKKPDQPVTPAATTNAAQAADVATSASVTVEVQPTVEAANAPEELSKTTTA